MECRERGTRRSDRIEGSCPPASLSLRNSIVTADFFHFVVERRGGAPKEITWRVDQSTQACKLLCTTRELHRMTLSFTTSLAG